MSPGTLAVMSYPCGLKPDSNGFDPASTSLVWLVSDGGLWSSGAGEYCPKLCSRYSCSVLSGLGSRAAGSPVLILLHLEPVFGTEWLLSVGLLVPENQSGRVYAGCGQSLLANAGLECAVCCFLSDCGCTRLKAEAEETCGCLRIAVPVSGLCTPEFVRGENLLA